MALRLPIDVPLRIEPGPDGLIIVSEDANHNRVGGIWFTWDDFLSAILAPPPHAGGRMSHVALLQTSEALETTATRIREHVAHDLKPTKDE